MEDESPESVTFRRRRRWREAAADFALGGVFLASVFIADKIISGEPNMLARILSASAPVAFLSLWWAFHARRTLRLDEFARAIEIRSFAIAGAALVWIGTVWGLMILYFSAPPPPLILVAPLAALIYGAARTIILSGYR